MMKHCLLDEMGDLFIEAKLNDLGLPHKNINAWFVNHHIAVFVSKIIIPNDFYLIGKNP
jgi:hypothetical protein